MYISLTLILSSSLCAASLCIQASSWLACHTPLHLITIVCKSVKIKYKFSFLSSSSKLVLWLCRTVLVQNFPYCTERSSINYVMQSGEGGGGVWGQPFRQIIQLKPCSLIKYKYYFPRLLTPPQAMEPGLRLPRVPQAMSVRSRLNTWPHCTSTGSGWGLPTRLDNLIQLKCLEMTSTWKILGVWLNTFSAGNKHWCAQDKIQGGMAGVTVLKDLSYFKKVTFPPLLPSHL